MTPGEVAFTAYVTAVEWDVVPRPILAAMWQRLRPTEQRAWDAAAQAVLDTCVAEATPVDVRLEDEETP